MKILSCIKKEKLVKNTGPNELKFLFLNLMQYITGHKGLVFFFFFNFYFYFILLYNTVLVLPYIDMKPPRAYMRSET